MKKETVYLIVVIMIGLIGGGIFFINGKSFIESKKEQRQKNIINCLTLHKVTLYVSSDCSFCEEQKDFFGDYYQKLKIVKCNKNGDWSENCSNKKINSVPTWIFPSSFRSVKSKLVSCLECKKKTDGMTCEDYCYTESDDGKWLKVSGVLNLDKLDEIFECYTK
jgi:hypothetical protein